VSEHGFCVQRDLADRASAHAHSGCGFSLLACEELALRGLGGPCSRSLNAGPARRGKHKQGERRRASLGLHRESLTGALTWLSVVCNVRFNRRSQRCKWHGLSVLFNYECCSVVMSLCWLAIKGKTGISNTDMLEIQAWFVSTECGNSC